MAILTDKPVADKYKFDKCVEELKDARLLLSVDTETTGIEGIKTGADYLMGVSLTYDSTNGMRVSHYFPFRHKGDDNLPLQCVNDLDHVLNSNHLIYHNRKFDLHSFHTIGIELDNMYYTQYDTMMEAHLWDEELLSKELDWLSKVFLKDAKDKTELQAKVNLVGWENVPPWIMQEYAKHDAELTYKLHEFFWPKLVSQELDHLWPNEQEYTNILYRMEQLGIKTDGDFINSKIEMGERVLESIESILSFNPNSNKQLGEFMLEDLHLPVVKRTPGGKPSFDKTAMIEYEELLQLSNNPIAQMVAEYRGWTTALGLFFRSMQEKRHPITGRIHTDYKQHGTVTGRLSSSRPNLQQIPRQSEKIWNGDAKLAFIPDDGFELVGFDYSQLEFRLAAEYGQDINIIETFSDPDSDVFQYLADLLSFQRQTCKHTTYCILYGGGLAKATATIAKFENIPNTNPELARSHYENFKASIPGIIRASQLATEKAESRGYVRLWTGRRRHLRSDHYRAFNSIVQGGGAEIVKQSQINCQDFEDDNCRMNLQVHDEIVFSIRQGYRDKYEPMIKEAMTGYFKDIFSVALKVESKIWNTSGLKQLEGAD